MAEWPPDGTTKIDRRPDARIVRSTLDEVKAIQTLLSDVYKDAGDGRVQNADDAGAERLVFGVFDRGWPQAGNSLLHGPALLMANDGPFFERHRNALHLALGSSSVAVRIASTWPAKLRTNENSKRG
jgi:hypothetical protein